MGNVGLEPLLRITSPMWGLCLIYQGVTSVLPGRLAAYDSSLRTRGPVSLLARYQCQPD